MKILLLIFVGIPLIEMMILIKLGAVMGFWNTMLLVIGTGVLGAYLARIEGMRTWLNIQNAMKAGDMPAEKMIDAFLILIAGVLLITPGLLTDITGFLLLVPQSRFLFRQWLRKKFDEALKRAREQGNNPNFRSFAP